MLTRLDLRGFTGDLVATLAPSRDDDDGPVTAVREIIAAVRARGDEALRELTHKFDGCDLEDPRVPAADIAAALGRVTPEFREALEYAAGEIRAYHEAQLAPEVALDRDGVSLRERVVPVDRAGCYIPGGRASYPSTVLMTVTPAQVAGVAQVVLTIPPDADGRIPDATLAAASLLGVDEIYRVGGAQAIAALAYGTQSIAPVDVIVGPGNAYVTLAKREVAGRRRDRVACRAVGARRRRRRRRHARARRGRPARPGRARPRRRRGARHVERDGRRCRRRCGERADRASAAALRDRSHARERRSLGARRRPRASDRRGQRDRAGAPRADDSRSRSRSCRWSATPAPCSAVRGRRPPSVTTWPASTTCSRRPAPRGSRARCASTTSASTCTSSRSTKAALRRVAPYVRAFADVEGLDEHGRSVALREAQP